MPTRYKIATQTRAETLTNKTLTSPVINNPTGITKTDINLSNVDNTSDANKPVSTAQQTALDLKANLASPTITTPTIAQINNTTGVALSTEHQTDNSGTIATSVVNGVKFKTGWGQIVGNGTISMTETVTLGNAFPTACLGVSITPLGGKVSATSAANIGEIVATVTANPFTGAATSITASNFVVTLARSAGTFGSNVFWGYTWIAWGY